MWRPGVARALSVCKATQAAGARFLLAPMSQTVILCVFQGVIMAYRIGGIAPVLLRWLLRVACGQGAGCAWVSYRGCIAA